MKSTVICHFFNEEVLLPTWLTHHRKLFDHGIMIDYASTDKSCDVIRSLCPSWEIRQSRNGCFEAQAVDDEVMDIEKEINGVKLALNVTEFLFINPSTSLSNIINQPTMIVNIPVHVGLDDENSGVDMSDHKSCLTSIKYIEKARTWRGSRYMHTHEHGNYSLGRHFTHHQNLTCFDHNDIFIIWLGFMGFDSEKIQQRKFQIQHRIPESDRVQRLGIEHFATKEEVINRIQSTRSNACILIDNDPTLKEIISSHLR